MVPQRRHAVNGIPPTARLSRWAHGRQARLLRAHLHLGPCDSDGRSNMAWSRSGSWWDGAGGGCQASAISKEFMLYVPRLNSTPISWSVSPCCDICPRSRAPAAARVRSPTARQLHELELEEIDVSVGAQGYVRPAVTAGPLDDDVVVRVQLVRDARGEALE